MCPGREAADRGGAAMAPTAVPSTRKTLRVRPSSATALVQRIRSASPLPSPFGENARAALAPAVVPMLAAGDPKPNPKSDRPASTVVAFGAR